MSDTEGKEKPEEPASKLYTYRILNGKAYSLRFSENGSRWVVVHDSDSQPVATFKFTDKENAVILYRDLEHGSAQLRRNNAATRTREKVQAFLSRYFGKKQEVK